MPIHIRGFYASASKVEEWDLSETRGVRGRPTGGSRQLGAAVAASGDRKIKTEEAGSRANLPRHAAFCASGARRRATGGCCYRGECVMRQVTC